MIAQAKAMSRGPNAPPPGIFPTCHGSNCNFSIGDGTVAYATCIECSRNSMALLIKNMQCGSYSSQSMIQKVGHFNNYLKNTITTIL